MFQQKPTRIELKLDDMSEYKAKRKEQGAEKKTSEPSSTQTPGTSTSLQLVIVFSLI